MSDQVWFWSEWWQEGEREADANIRAGRVKFSPSTEAFLAHLDEMIEEGGSDE